VRSTDLTSADNTNSSNLRAKFHRQVDAAKDA